MPLNRGDFGEGDPPSPACAMEVKLGGTWSDLARFKDLDRAGSGSEVVTGSDKFVLKRGADTPACSDAMSVVF